MTCTLRVDVDPAIRRTVVAAVRAMEEAGLDHAADEMLKRVLHSDRFTETWRTCDGVIAVRLHPYAELVLREAQHIGTMCGLDSATREARIAQALNMAGF